MEFDYPDLEKVRSDMVSEIRGDIGSGEIYNSTRLTERGVESWGDWLLESARVGHSGDLANELRSGGAIAEFETYSRNGNVHTRRVPATAADTLAEGEFNRYYLRGLALYALANNLDIEVCRGRVSLSPRESSTAIVGTEMDPRELLDDLRANPGVDAALGLPPGPNSGLTGRLKLGR
jgi:hypothetical protein